jgi:hypothetical protein
MSIANQLLKLSAKVALDRLIGAKRTDELVTMLQKWSLARDKAGELSDAKYQAANPQAVQDVVNSVIVQAGEAGTKITHEQREKLAFTVASGIALLEEPPTDTKLWESFVPGKAKTFVVYLDDPRFTAGGPGRFFHFNWDKEGYRIRDYIGGRILHPLGSTPGNAKLTPVPMDMSVLEIWNASKVRVHSVRRYGLGFKTSEMDRWREVLSLLTESARQLRPRW